MKLTDEQRLKKVYENAIKLDKYIKDNDIKKENLLTEYSLQWLVTTPLYNIGEHIYHISDEFKERYQDIQWNMIAGLRHRLVHDYEGTNWNIIVEVVFEEIPELINKVREILGALNVD